MRLHHLLIGTCALAAGTISVVGVVNAAGHQHTSPAPALAVQAEVAPALAPQPGQTITVHVPPTAFVRVDAQGTVTAAATNTGAAPQPGDDVYLFHPDGTITHAPSFDLGAVTWLGDFSQPGVYLQQN